MAIVGLAPCSAFFSGRPRAIEFTAEKCQKSAPWTTTKTKSTSNPALLFLSLHDGGAHAAGMTGMRWAVSMKVRMIFDPVGALSNRWGAHLLRKLGVKRCEELFESIFVPRRMQSTAPGS